MKNSRFKISYDPQIFTMQKYGGVSRYFTELAQELSKGKDVEVDIIAPISICEYLKKINSNLFRGIGISSNVILSNKKFTGLINLFIKAISFIGADIYLRMSKPNLIHETYFSPFALGSKDVTRVLTIHDMIHEKFPNQFPAADRTSRYKALAAKRANHIICVSESTKRDAIEILNLDPSKVSVVYHGFSNFLTLENGLDGDETSFIKEPYLLYVGQRGGYKNFKNLLLAYATSKKLHENFKIVCFGGGNFSTEEISFLSKSGLDLDKIIQCGGDDHLLGVVYKNAAAFVYPSLYEGFGIPLLEAMSAGCPVICSNTSSIPEVVGNAGEYFDPESIIDIQHAIERVVFSDETRHELILKGNLRKKNFTWEKCANESLAVYKIAAKSFI